MNDVSDVISKYDGEINKAISLYRVRAKMYGVDVDDLRQDCRIEVWNCLKKKPETDPYFIPYIRASLRKRIRANLIKKTENCSHQNFYKQKRKFADVANLKEQYFPDDYTAESLFSYNDNTEENIVVTDFIKFCTRKSPDYGLIVKNRLKGLTVEEVAETTNIVERDVYRKIIDIKDLYREYFGVEENNDNSKTSSKNHPH